MIFIIPVEENKPIEFVDEDVKVDLDDDGNMIIERKMTANEIADLFDVSVSDVLSGDVKIGVYELRS